MEHVSITSFCVESGRRRAGGSPRHRGGRSAIGGEMNQRDPNAHLRYQSPHTHSMHSPEAVRIHPHLRPSPRAVPQQRFSDAHDVQRLGRSDEARSPAEARSVPSLGEEGKGLVAVVDAVVVCCRSRLRPGRRRRTPQGTRSTTGPSSRSSPPRPPICNKVPGVVVAIPQGAGHPMPAPLVMGDVRLDTCHNLRLGRHRGALCAQVVDQLRVPTQCGLGEARVPPQA